MCRWTSQFCFSGCKQRRRFNRSIISQVNSRPYAHGTQHSTAEEKWRKEAEFNIQDLMCRTHYAHLLRPTYSQNLGKKYLLIAFGNTQLRQIRKHNRHRLSDWEDRTKRGWNKEKYFHLFWVELTAVPYLHTCKRTQRQTHNFSNCHVQIIVSLQ